MTPDDFHAYRENLQSGATEVQISEHYDGGDDVEGEDERERFDNEPDTNSE